MGVSRAINVDEIVELMRYAAYLGLDKQHTTLGALCDALGKFEKAEGDERENLACELLKQYAELCRLTHPVNGGTLLDTGRMWWLVWPIMLWTFVFLVLGLGNEVLDLYLSDITEPRDGALANLYVFQNYVLDYASPFFWGGLGSCVYILKRLSDRAAERTFYAKVLHGWGTRILLGAVLGSVVQYLYDPTSLTDGQIRLDANAVAFLAGVGTKVVYGAIEKTIQTLAEKMNLDALRTETRVSFVRSYLSKKLSETDWDADAAKRQALIELIDEIDDEVKKS